MNLTPQDLSLLSVTTLLNRLGLSILSQRMELGTGGDSTLSKASDDLSQLTLQELEALERDLLAEQINRTLSNPNAVVVEPNAPETFHEHALQTVLQRKGIKL